MAITTVGLPHLFRSLPSLRLTPTLATSNGRGPDLDQMEFRIQMECKGIEPDRFSRQLRDLRWTASACPGDCSHGRDGGYTTYQRINSPTLTIAGGGLQQLAEVLDRLQKAGGRPGETGAFRIHIPDKYLDDQGTTNLVNMHLNNEHILYRLGQAGGQGRAIEDKQRWSPPLSQGSAYTNGGMSDVARNGTAKQWKNTLANYHWGMNAGTQGMWEFRYFDSTLDANAAAGNVKLLLGMVKAAAEGRGNWDQVNAVHRCFTNQVDRRQWNKLMNEVADPDLKRQLEANFRNSGGNLEKETMGAAVRKAISQLVKNNYRFEDGGQALSMDDIAQRLDADRPLQVVLPQNQRLDLRADQVGLFVSGEVGDNAELPKELVEQTTAAANLAKGGIALTDRNGTALSPFQAALLSADDGRVQASRGGESASIGASGLTLAEIAAIESGDLRGLSPATRATVSALPFLRDHGYEVQSSDGSKPTWAPRIATVCKSGNLVLGKGDKTIPIKNWQALEGDVMYPEKIAQLSDEDRTLFDQVSAAADKGFSFSRPGQEAPQKGTVPFFMTVMGGTGDLQVQVPGAPAATPLPNREVLKTFVLTELGQDGALDDNARKILDTEAQLRQKDYKFFNKRTEDEIRSRSGVLVTLSSDGQRLTMRAPGAKRRTRLTQKAMENVLHMENGRADQMDPALRGAVERGKELRDAGFGLKMKDIIKDGQWVDANQAEVLATLEGGRRVALIDPAGNQTVAVGTNDFLQKADAQLQVSRALTAEQTQALNAFGTLLGGGQIVTDTMINGERRAVTQPGLVPWVFANGDGMQVRGRQEAIDNGVQIRGWNDLQQFIDTETGAPQPGAPNAAVLTQTQDLKARGVRFYYVNSPRSNPVAIGLNSALVQHIENDGVRAQLPRWSFWKGFPRKNITIQGQGDLARLSRKFER